MKKITVLLVLVLALESFGFIGTVHASGADDSITHLLAFTKENIVFYAKRTLYVVFSLDRAREDIGYLESNLEKIILMNPDPKSDEILKPLSFFIKLIQPLYVLAIALTGFYLLLISGTPSGRARAKSLLMNLILGMIIISFSQYILEVMVYASSRAAGAIIGQIPVSEVSSTIDANFGGPLCPLCVAHFFLTMIEIELGYFSFLPFLMVVWGALIVLYLRFVVVSLFMILFPISVLLYSFQTTKDLGRNMIEELILWTMLQSFNAVVVVAIALALIQKPAGYMDITMPLPYANIEFPFTPVFELMPFIGCLVIAIAPLFVLRLFRNFLPP